MYHLSEIREIAQDSDDPTERREMRRLAMRLENAHIPHQFQGWEWTDLEPYQGKVVEQAKRWVDNVVDGKVVEAEGSSLSGVGLLLTGEPGHGKTALASVVIQSLLRESTLGSWGDLGRTPAVQPSRPAYMTYYRNYMDMLSRQMDDALTEDDLDLLRDIQGRRTAATAIKVLCLDDLGKEYRTASGWATGQFEGLIRTRYYSGWPTVITSNVPLSKWETVYGESAASFAHEAFINLSIIAPEGDRRVRR